MSELMLVLFLNAFVQSPDLKAMQHQIRRTQNIALHALCHSVAPVNYFALLLHECCVLTELCIMSYRTSHSCDE